MKLIQKFDAKSLSYCSLLTALAVIFSILSFYITPAIKFSLSFVFIAIIAANFGVVPAAFSAAISDIIQYLIKPIGPWQPLLTLTAAITGIIFGLILYKNKTGIIRIIISRLVTSLFISSIIDTYLIAMLYGKVFTEFFTIRLTKNLILLPLEILAMYLSFKAINKINLKIK